MPSVIILPDSDQTTLCLRLTGHITAKDFENHYHQEIVKRVKANGFFNMVVCYDENYEGWTEEAAQQNLKSIFELGSKPHRLAYVNPPRRKILLMKMADGVVTGEIRYFEHGQYDEAVQWVKQAS